MSTVISRVTRPSDEASGPELSTGPITRVVLLALATGVVGAAATTLSVVAGASEHTVTGSALLAFAAGWAVLALASVRLTNQPQRWAVVPAAVMGAVGLCLVVSGPGEATMTASGWVWPPALLALTVWMVRQARRGLRGRARGVLYPVFAFLALASVGGMVETVALAHDRAALAMPGKSYDVGGRHLHLSCTGTGSPTVVLSSGTSEFSASWARVTSLVGRSTRVCAYDRAGQGWSDDAPRPQDAHDIAVDLQALLIASGEPGPYVLVGHSLGGVYGMTFAAEHPDEVAGLVLLDSSTPEQFTALPKYAGIYSNLRRMYGVLPSLARLGVGRLVGTRMISALPQPAAGEVRAFATSSRGLENARDDSATYRTSFVEARALRTLDGKPLVVLTSSESASSTPGWAAAQSKLASLSTNVWHRTVTATHSGLLDDGAGARLSSDAVMTAVRAVRTGGLVPRA